MRQVISLPVTGAIPQGRDGFLLSFSVPNEHRDSFCFKPGQYLTLRGGQEEAVWRCYSITSAPQRREGISVLVKRVPGGKLSNWLCDHAKVGLSIEVLPPAGSFLLARPDHPVLLYAGGSGIAPIYALAPGPRTGFGSHQTFLCQSRHRLGDDAHGAESSGSRLSTTVRGPLLE